MDGSYYRREMDLKGVGWGAAVSGAVFIDFGLRTGYPLLTTDQCNEDDSFWFIVSLYIFGVWFGIFGALFACMGVSIFADEYHLTKLMEMAAHPFPLPAGSLLQK